MSSDSFQSATVDPRENHEQFVASLERHGYSATPPAWEVMANELGWSSEEVKVYAYHYFVALHESEVANDITEVKCAMNENQTARDESRKTSANTWTLEESMLFEASLVQHLPLVKKEHRSNAAFTWGKLIASMIPNKTPEEVVHFYFDNYEQLVQGKQQQL